MGGGTRSPPAGGVPRQSTFGVAPWPRQEVKSQQARTDLSWSPGLGLLGTQRRTRKTSGLTALEAPLPGHCPGTTGQPLPCCRQSLCPGAPFVPIHPSVSHSGQSAQTPCNWLASLTLHHPYRRPAPRPAGAQPPPSWPGPDGSPAVADWLTVSGPIRGAGGHRIPVDGHTRALLGADGGSKSKGCRNKGAHPPSTPTLSEGPPKRGGGRQIARRPKWRHRVPGQ